MTDRIAKRVELHEFEPRKHASLLEAWLKRPHVIEWWGDQSQELPILLGRGPGTHAVIVADGIAVGYLCWGTPTAEELAAAGLNDLPDPLVDIDILIGDTRFVGCGIGARALHVLAERLRQDAEPRWAGIGTSRSNQAALSAFAKAGFRPFCDFEDPHYGPCRYFVMRLRGAV